MANNTKNISRLLNPKSIAVIGGREAAEVIRQCRKSGYEGDIWPVNVKRETIKGLTCYQTLSELPSAPDASFIAIPADATVEIVKQLNDLGAGGAVCYASGFAETGEQGAKRQRRLIAAAGDLAIMGPNCHGLINYRSGAALWPDQHGGQRQDKGVAIISQSGNIAISLTMQQRSLPIAYLISVGNQACMQMHDYMRVLLDDEHVTAIGLHLEGLADIAAFSAAARLALQKKIPVVAIKAGRSELAQTTAMSHTSSLTGPDKLYDALFHRYGIARVNSLSQFVETLKLLSINGPVSGNDIATISCSGGEAALAADLAHTNGLDFPALTNEQQTELSKVLGDRVSLANPLDYHTYIWGNYQAQEDCFSAITKGQQSFTVKFLDFPIPGLCDTQHWQGTAKSFVKALQKNNASGAVVSTLNESLPEETRSLLVAACVAPMQGLEECFIAIKNAGFIHRAQHKPKPKLLLQPAQIDESKIVNLDEWESKQLLHKYGIDTPKGKEVTRQNVVNAAKELTYPLVVKALSPELAHKSEVGGVRLNIKNDQALVKALNAMEHLSDRFLLEEMVEQAVAEMILGLSRDEQFGLALTIGTGGIWTEIFQDAVSILLPCTEDEVFEAIKTLKLYKVLTGVRGKPAGDIKAVVRAVLNLANLAQDHNNSLVELDINPLMVLVEGKGVIACDAFVRRTSIQ